MTDVESCSTHFIFSKKSCDLAKVGCDLLLILAWISIRDMMKLFPYHNQQVFEKERDYALKFKHSQNAA